MFLKCHDGIASEALAVTDYRGHCLASLSEKLISSHAR